MQKGKFSTKGQVLVQDWNQTLYRAIHAARLGRDVLLHYYGRLQHIEHKFQAGLVSEADRESEKAIFGYLRQHFPEDQLIGEESTADLKAAEKVKALGRWIVDPLDGTTNYVHGFHVFCVSIGYQWEGKMQVGVIDVPMLGEVYTAIRGKGAFCNGQALHVSKTAKIEDALLATGFWSENEKNLEEQLKVFPKLVRKAQGVRRAGAAAYDLCMVAKGAFDGYWEKGLKAWDSAAGSLIVEEAGGVVTTYKKKAFDPFKNSIIAANPSIAALIADDMSGLLNSDSD